MVLAASHAATGWSLTRRVPQVQTPGELLLLLLLLVLPCCLCSISYMCLLLSLLVWHLAAMRVFKSRWCCTNGNMH
jgi:hypothetical protein